MKISALFHRASGALEAVAQPSTQTHEIPLFLRLFSRLRRGDIWLGDALYGVFVMLAYSGRMGVDAIARVKRPRRLDFRKGRKLGPNERVAQGNKPQKKPGYLSERIWAVLPKTLDLRLIRVTLFREGFRPLRFYGVTPRLDDVKYPAELIASLYRRRWRLELCFRDLKTSRGMEALRAKTPAMAEKELLWNRA